MNNAKRQKKKSPIVQVMTVLSLGITIYLLTQYSPKALGRTVFYLGKLFVVVGIFTFLGTIFELRNWTRCMSRVVNPLVSFARFPQISGLSMLTALFSNKAANTMLAAAYGGDQIERRSMISTGMCNGYLTFVSHSLRVMFPVVGALGVPALLYFGIQFSLGLLITVVVMLIHRYLSRGSVKDDVSNMSQQQKELLSWKQTLQRALERTTRILSRILVVTVPLYLLMTQLMRSDAMNSLEKMIPDSLQIYLNAELMAVMLARLGGLLSAASVAGQYYQDSVLTALQIVWALLLGNLVTNPLRTLRRNLPSAMGIFPPKDGMTIVLTMQVSRFMTTLSVVVVLTFFIARSMI